MTSDVYGAQDVLEWFETPDAAATARRVAARRGLGGADALTDNVLHDARVAVLLRMQSCAPLEVERPAAYGTQVIKSVVRALVQGRDRVTLERWPNNDGPDAAQEHVAVDHGDVHSLDDLRVVVERLSGSDAWLTSAALSVLTLRAYPEIELAGVPQPDGGATPDQARGWPALWFAGRRDVFPDDGDGPRERARKRQARSRLIRTVLARLAAAGALYRSERADGDG